MQQKLRIRNLEIPADFPDLTELEKDALVRIVEERFAEIEHQTRLKVVDTARLALLTAASFAHDLQRVEDQVRLQRQKEETKLDESLSTLQEVLQKK